MFKDISELSSTGVQFPQKTHILSGNESSNVNELSNNESQALDTQNDNFLVLPSNSKKRNVEELFGDITDLDDDTFLNVDIPTVKKSKKDDIEEKLALIEHIIELRRLAREKSKIVGIVSSNKLTYSIDRDKHNMSYRVPKYPFIAVTRSDKERIYVRFHSEEYEKEEVRRIVKESTFSGVLGERFKEVWKEATNLVCI